MQFSLNTVVSKELTYVGFGEKRCFPDFLHAYHNYLLFFLNLVS